MIQLNLYKSIPAKYKIVLLSGLIFIFLPISTLFLYIALTPPPLLLENVSFSPIILDRHGNLMYLGLSKDDKYRQHALLKNIPEHVQKVVLLYEDRYFYKHPGVNPISLIRAVKNTIFGKRRMGASTIAMQVARLRYKLITNTISGKLKQILLALQLIWHYGHNKVLEAYFSLAPYGGNIEGIRAASRIYFHQSMQNLIPSQALALSLIPQNPQRRSFTKSKNGRLIARPNLEKARNNLHNIWNNTYPQDLVPNSAPPLKVFTLKEMPLIAPHMVMEYLKNIKENSNISKTIYSTIDIKIQKIINNNIQKFINNNTMYGLKNASALLLHWPSMEVHALVGSADFYSKDIDGQIDGTKARRSPGSTLKPFIYALALDQGLIHSQTMLIDTPKSFGEYNPENFDKQFQGPLPACEALRLSRNIPAIELASKLNPSLYAFLKRAKIDLKHNANYYGLSLVLGGAELSMRNLVNLYAMLANGGIWQPLQTLQKNNQEELDIFPLLSPEAALATLYMLEPHNISLNIQRNKLPLRYKTGTSNGFRDAWCIGIIGHYVLAIWLGNFDNSSNSMLVGTKVAVPLFKKIANILIWKQNLTDVLATKYKSTKLIQREVCRDTGDVQINLCPEKTLAWFIPGRSPIKNSNIYRKIWIDPHSGLRLCGPSTNAKEVIWEFWPSELYQLFIDAGLHKPLPPPFAEPCTNMFTNQWNNTISIKTPREGIIYHMNNTVQNTLPLTATSTAHTHTLFWFVNKNYIGSSPPHKALFWPMKVGTHRIQVLNDLGQSHSITLQVRP